MTPRTARCREQHPKKCLTCFMSMLWNLCEEMKTSRKYDVYAAAVQESMKPWLGFGADGTDRPRRRR